MMPEERRYFILVQEHGASRSPLRDATQEQAWSLARELRARGLQTSIMVVEVDGTTQCIVRDDEPLD